MGVKWRKIKELLGMKVCAFPRTDLTSCNGDRHFVDAPEPRHSSTQVTDIAGDADAQPAYTRCISMPAHSAPATPNHHVVPDFKAVSTGRRSLRHPRGSCSICLESMKPGQGHALFTAECSHTFHFSCIASNVRHGNLVCPVCRAKWRDVPWQAPTSAGDASSKNDVFSLRPGIMRMSRSRMSRGFSSATSGSRIHESTRWSSERQQRHSAEHMMALRENDFLPEQSSQVEPICFDDDESLTMQVHLSCTCSSSSLIDMLSVRDGDGGGAMVDLKLHPEVFAVPGMKSMDNFAVVAHVKAPSARSESVHSTDASYQFHGSSRAACRAPLDLVTVLDVSGSMAGSKVLLLKKAMQFVIRNLSGADRMSVVVFSSCARRLLALRRMTEEGKQQAMRVIDSLDCSGGTNIAEGLCTGARVLQDRRHQNQVAAIILLSDGQDTYTITSRRHQMPYLSRTVTDPLSTQIMLSRLLPSSMRHTGAHEHNQAQVPVHSFGFGVDHDAAVMHSISEVSGGTFSFIETEEILQDAFAQCIGGLLSVVVQDVQLKVSCSVPGVYIESIHAGSYDSRKSDDARHGFVKLGDLYADEERDVLIELQLPKLCEAEYGTSMCLMHAGCSYKDSVSTQGGKHEIVDDLFILRPQSLEEGEQVPSLEVDRQRNRFSLAKAIVEARSLADEGHMSAAQSRLEGAQCELQSSASALAGDKLCRALGAELSEMIGRMASQQAYERSGRAYLLSAESSHLRQRATTRGESQLLERGAFDYQTPSMVDMLTCSHTLQQSTNPPHCNATFTKNTGSMFGSSSSCRDKGNLTSASSSSHMSNFLSRRSSTRVRSSQERI